MSEVLYRFLIGTALLVCLFIDYTNGLYIIAIFLAFEGVTNFLLTKYISKLRFGKAELKSEVTESYRFNFESERVLRLAVFTFLILGTYFFPSYIWFMPWFVSFMLFMSGITNVCPMSLFFKWVGFK